MGMCSAQMAQQFAQENPDALNNLRNQFGGSGAAPGSNPDQN